MNIIRENELRAGDVLLSMGDSELSAAIRGLDGGAHSHAALWCGEGLIESTLPCVRRAPLAEAASHALYIDVYRHAQASRVARAVTAAAQRYLERPYGTLNLSLSTLVVSVSTWMPDQWTALNLLYGAGNLARLLGSVQRAVARASSPRVTCVELVARAYLEAGAPVSIRLRGHGDFDGVAFAKAVRSLLQRLREETPQPIEGEDLEWLDQLIADADSGHSRSLGEPLRWPAIRADWERALGLSPHAAMPEAAPEREVVPRLIELSVQEIRAKELVVGEGWLPALLTPRQLSESPELELIGRIHQR